ncbi:MAG: hypothetical protein HC923_08795 [Myxococcales bacterium]|nr:hypothetical protein [Myxococcales bacterium]
MSSIRSLPVAAAAAGDVDGNPTNGNEVVACASDASVVALAVDGSVRWKSAPNTCGTPYPGDGFLLSVPNLADLDEDGVPETTKYYDEIPDPERPGQRKTILVRQELDLTWDGRTDICRYFGAHGKVEREEWDLDYDGRVDEVRYYEDGVITRSERDRNNDGRPEVFRYFSEGKLERKETDSNGDGKVDRWEYYDGRVLDRIGVDKDHDGSVDTWAKAATKG